VELVRDRAIWGRPLLQLVAKESHRRRPWMIAGADQDSLFHSGRVP
jgi:hypothetical protein